MAQSSLRLWAAGILHAASAACLEDYSAFRHSCLRGMPNTFRPGVHSADRNTLLTLIDESIEAVRCCFNLGGRAWELGFDLFWYLERLRVSAPDLAQRVARDFSNPEDADGSVLYGVFCAPSSCTEKTIAPAALRYLIADICHLEVERVLAPDPDLASVVELGDWANVRVDFVVAGLARCGTTSVESSLFQHPEIDFTSGATGEDYTIFGQGQQNKFVPTREQVAFHHSRYAGKNSSSRLLGLKNPGIATYPLSYYTIWLLRRMKLILVVCDPLGRIEKEFMIYHYCHDDVEAAVLRADTIPSKHRARKDCDRSIRALSSRQHKGWLLERMISRHLMELMTLFGHDRLLVLHRASFRDAPLETYSHVAKWLGATQPFPEEVIFKRRNFRLGHRTDLCRNVSLQRTMKRLLAPEYDALLRALAWQSFTFPQRGAQLELGRKITRCDMPQELLAGPCGLIDSSDEGCPT
ncbi:unnamed protein product [Effrenium voratum]|nr:unnamed protein product [Effrenium voratum]